MLEAGRDCDPVAETPMFNAPGRRPWPLSLTSNQRKPVSILVDSMIL